MAAPRRQQSLAPTHLPPGLVGHGGALASANHGIATAVPSRPLGRPAQPKSPGVIGTQPSLHGRGPATTARARFEAFMLLAAPDWASSRRPRRVARGAKARTAGSHLASPSCGSGGAALPSTPHHVLRKPPARRPSRDKEPDGRTARDSTVLSMRPRRRPSCTTGGLVGPHSPEAHLQAAERRTLSSAAHQA